MVIQSINGIYMHCAWGTSAQGADFSLTEFADATYRGIYYDRSPAESMDPISYKWILIDSIDGNATEDDAIEAENAAALANAQAEQANSQTIVNNDNLQASQYSTDDKVGNPNELVGTNQGTNGWTASADLTISAVTDTIYNPTDDPVNYLHVVCDSAGSNYIYFDAQALRGKLSELTDDNAFTFSADLRMSTVFALSVAVQNVDGTDQQIDFGTIDTELIPVPEETADGLWTFNKLTADMVGGVAESSQVLYIDLSNMGAGETLDIANLKIEGGALATPWRASLDEVANIANQAYSVANNTEQHFWFQSTGLDTGAHITEVDKDTWAQDPANGGGNLLARSNGVAIRDGLDEIATFKTVYGEGVVGLQDENACLIGGWYDTANNQVLSRYVTEIPNASPAVSARMALGAKASMSSVRLSATDNNGSIYLDVSYPTVVTNGGISADGNITANGHSTPIGYNNTGSGTKNNFPNNSQTELVGGISVTAGTWLLLCRVGFPTSTTGRRFACWHNDTTAADYYTSYCSSPAVSGGYTNIQTVMTIQVSGNTTFSVHAFQNSGSSMNVAYNWTITRIA